jgi:hypothetical protein
LQDAEKVALLTRPAQTRQDAPFPPASFSHRSDPQRGPGRLTYSAARTDVVLLIRRTVRPRGYASALYSLLPRWTAFLSILREHSPAVAHGGLSKYRLALLILLPHTSPLAGT